jgi:hypothetical protein
LSNKDQDKAVYGVLSNNMEDSSMCMVNSVGEGAIWVSNKNGPLDNGDYICSSSILGYGQKQTSDQMQSYTVAKIHVACNFNPTLVLKRQAKFDKDASGNPSSIMYDEDDNVIFEEITETLSEYELRYLLPDGKIIDKITYDNLTANNTTCYIAAFLPCSYHCG